MGILKENFCRQYYSLYALLFIVVCRVGAIDVRAKMSNGFKALAFCKLKGGKSTAKGSSYPLFLKGFQSFFNMVFIRNSTRELYPQLIKKRSMLNKVQDFLTYV